MNPIYVGDHPHRVRIDFGGPDGDDWDRCTMRCERPGCTTPDLSPMPFLVAVVLADQHLTDPPRTLRAVPTSP